jgi:hypothetical protein
MTAGHDGSGIRRYFATFANFAVKIFNRKERKDRKEMHSIFADRTRTSR